MSEILATPDTHEKSESKTPESPSKITWPLDTPGGRFHAEWCDDAPVTREGSLIFFFQFLHASGRWDKLTEAIPLRYESNRANDPKDVIGTMLLSTLCGHFRYAHINSIRGDGVNPGLLGMAKTVSEDTVRYALKKMDETETLNWLTKCNLEAVSPILFLPWILDIDNTVKCLYGHQEGAQIGYNPQKPGRPSHNYHSYFVANLRLSLGADVLPGKVHAAKEGLPGMWRILDALPRSHWPYMVRGDCAYGVEIVLNQCEDRGLPHLSKLRNTPNVKKLVQQSLREGAVWQDAADGWQYLESTLQLCGWSKKRRVVLVREGPTIAPVGQNAKRRRNHNQEQLGEGEGWDAKPTPWSGKISVLVTSLLVEDINGYALTRLYRERADAENIIDEIKNQWGWCGFTTKKLSPCRIMANFIALVYNLWSLYVRFYDQEHHREALTTRPKLMQGVARQVEGGGQKRIKISLMHQDGDIISKAITLISKEIQHIAAITEQWRVSDRWLVFLMRICRKYLGGKHLPNLLPEAIPLLAG
jgi:Transposase DDE domain group 1